jgi:hypothetical protein
MVPVEEMSTEGRPTRSHLGVVAAFVAVAALYLAALAPTADARTTWLCKPGANPNPCFGSLQTTVIDPSGQSHVENPHNAKRPAIDCFYVYPTVSDDKTINADLSIDPEETAIALYQASRFSQRCRVFAPMYRQLTLQVIGATELPPEAISIAYSDVRAAWKEYMRRYNHGRGVVLIGHSQGSAMLEQLIRQKIDPFPAARRQLVSAIVLGGNVTVQRGRNVGGVFRHIPGCRSARRTACVIAYSTFNEPPPADTLYGTPTGRISDFFGQSGRTDLEVLCTNPAALRGGSAPLHTLAPTTPFPGTIGVGIRLLYNGTPPTAPTPWVEPMDHFSGACVESNGANVLMVTPIADARQPTPIPDATWGLHLADVNIALGNLVDVVGSETKAFLRQRAKRKRH